VLAVHQRSRVGLWQRAGLWLPAVAVAASLLACDPVAAWQSYLTCSLEAPVLCAACTSSVKGVVSDAFAQLVVERSPILDLRRTLAFATYGATYLGLIAQWKYNVLFSRLFGSSMTVPSIAAKVLFDLGICGAFLSFPSYYLTKGLFTGSGVSRSLAEYFSPKGWQLLKKYWLVWFPVQVLMWTVVPPPLRITFVCAVSLVWQVVLSTLSHAKN